MNVFIFVFFLAARCEVCEDAPVARLIGAIVKHRTWLNVGFSDCYQKYWGTLSKLSSRYYDWVLIDVCRNCSIREVVNKAAYGIITRGNSTLDARFEMDIDATMSLQRASPHPFGVWNRRNLVFSSHPTDFLRLQNDTIEWNDAVYFAGKEYRAYVPRVNWSVSLIIGVPSVPDHTDVRSAIRNTWASRSNRFAVLFIIAQPTERIVEESAAYQDIILLEAREIMKPINSSLTLKTYAFAQIIASRASNETWMLKVDEDTFVFVDRLLRHVAEYTNAERIYVGNGRFVRPIRDARVYTYISHQSYPATFLPMFMSGGAGFLLSNAAVRCISNASQTNEFHYFPCEDVSVGLTLRAYCTPYSAISLRTRFLLRHPIGAPDSDVMTIHRVKGSKTIYSLWRRFINSTIVS